MLWSLYWLITLQIYIYIFSICHYFPPPAYSPMYLQLVWPAQVRNNHLGHSSDIPDYGGWRVIYKYTHKAALLSVSLSVPHRAFIYWWHIPRNHQRLVAVVQDNWNKLHWLRWPVATWVRRPSGAGRMSWSDSHSCLAALGTTYLCPHWIVIKSKRTKRVHRPGVAVNRKPRKSQTPFIF